MYLSRVFIDMGDNPDRPRPGRLWLRNVYHVHQRLCMAFPSDPRKQRDPDFLAPYAPDDFPEQRHLADKKKSEVGQDVLKQVHAKRGADTGFLFRVESGPGGSAIIRVQSAIKPDWNYAFHNAGYLLAPERFEVHDLDPSFLEGQRLRFILVANPTRRLCKNSLGADGQPVHEKDIGKRVPVRNDRLIDWLLRQGESNGFRIEEGEVLVQTGFVYFDKRTREGEEPQRGRLRSVRYDGRLTVTDPKEFGKALAAGIGSGKAFGFGLLSVLPLR